MGRREHRFFAPHRQAFVRRTRAPGAYDEAEAEDDDAPDYTDAEVTDAGGAAASGVPAAAAPAPAMSATDEDLLGMGGLFSAPAPAPAAVAAAPATRAAAAPPPPAAAGGGLDDLFGDAFGSAPAPAPARPAVPEYPVLGEKDGLVVRGGLARRDRATVLDLVIENTAGGS